jgi:predicted MPP superfamily phosphohydrolase
MGWPAYVVLVLVCSLGHALIWVRVINWSHGFRFQVGLIDVVRFGLHLILGGCPLLFVYLTWQSLPEEGIYALPLGLHPYLGLTGVLGALVFPGLVLQHWCRRPCPALQSEANEIHSIAELLRFRPVGHGKWSWLAHLPFNQAYELELAEKEIVLPRLPAAWDGMRLLHLSDLHFWGRPGRAYFEAVLQLCAQRPCDLLLLTGDLIDGESYDWLQLLKVIPWSQGAYAIRGNHDARYDASRVTDELRQLGIHMVGGQTHVTSLRDQPLLIAGNEAPWLLPIPDLEAETQFEGFRLALIHSPDQFRWAKRHGFDLVLAGHNHGGQIRCPGFGSIFVPSRTGRRYDMGLFQEQGAVIHVSRGISGGHPVRYFCRPEATWLTLRRAEMET